MHKGLTQKLNFVHVEFWHLFKQNGHTNDYLTTPPTVTFQRIPIHKPLDILSRKQRLNVFHKLGSMPTSLACPVVVLSCFACPVFRTIPRPFEATKTRGDLNVINPLSMKTGWRNCAIRVGRSQTWSRKQNCTRLYLIMIWSLCFLLTARPWAERGSRFTRGLFFFFLSVTRRRPPLGQIPSHATCDVFSARSC